MEKKKQNQPKHHAAKNKIAVKQRRKKIIKAAINGENVTQAGIDSGLSPKTAAAQVSAILKEPEVEATICQIFERAGFTNEAIAKELAIIGFSDPANHAEIAEGGELRFKTFEEQGEHRRAIEAITEKTTIGESKDGSVLFKKTEVKWKLHDKQAALDRVIAVKGIQKPTKVDLNLEGSIMAAVAARLGEKK